MINDQNQPSNQARKEPMKHLDEWELDLQSRYPKPSSSRVNLEDDRDRTCDGEPQKAREAFRDYDAEARSSVKEFYRLNHQFQTYDFVQRKRNQYLSRGLELIQVMRDEILLSLIWIWPAVL